MDKNKKIDLEALEGIVYEDQIDTKDSSFVMTSNGVAENDFHTTKIVYRVEQKYLKNIFGDSFVCDEDDVLSTSYNDIPELKDEAWEIIFNKEKGE